MSNRPLTDRELSFRPSWATHYAAKGKQVIFFNEHQAVNLYNSVLGKSYENGFGIEYGDTPLPPLDNKYYEDMDKSSLIVGMTALYGDFEVILKDFSEISGWYIKFSDGGSKVVDTYKLKPFKRDTRTAEQVTQDTFSDWLSYEKYPCTGFVEAVKSGKFPNVVWKG